MVLAPILPVVITKISISWRIHKYENQTGQGVNPYSGKTVSQQEAHHPINN
jgi:hypothetical protein